MKLQNYTHMELLDLQSKISEEFKERENRKKVRAFRVHVLFNAPEYYLSYDNALAAVVAELNDDYNKEDFQTEANPISISLGVEFINQSDVKNCKDYVPEPTASEEPSIPDHKGERVITWDKLDRIEKPSPHLKFTWSCPYCGKRTNELRTTTPTGLAEVTCANDECEAFMYLKKLKEEE